MHPHTSYRRCLDNLSHHHPDLCYAHNDRTGRGGRPQGVASLPAKETFPERASTPVDRPMPPKVLFLDPRQWAAKRQDAIEKANKYVRMGVGRVVVVSTSHSYYAWRGLE
jgi:hypothetical protein